MTLAQLRVFTRRLLNEVSATDSFWEESDLDDYLNRGNELFHALTEIRESSSTYSSVASQLEYPLKTEVIRPKRVHFLDPTTSKFKKLTVLTIEELELEDEAWFTKVADAGTTPTKASFRGSTLYVVPAPNATATNNIRVWGVHGPADDLPATGPDFVAVYHQALAFHAAILAIEQDQSSPGASSRISRLSKWWDRFVSLAAIRETQKGPPYRLRDVRDFFTQEWRE